MPQYNYDTTGEQVAADCQAQIEDKTVLVTGASPGGLGAAFAAIVAQYKPACFILTARTADKAQETAAEIARIAPGVRTHCVALDLCSLEKVRAAAAEIDALCERVDVLVNNAGIMGAKEYTQSADGIESHFAACHVGHFLLTNLLLSKALAPEASADAPRKIRVVNVASDGYRLGPVRFEDWNFDDGKTYNRWFAYAQAKSANMLFSRSLAQKLGKRGVTSISLHPGYIMTGLTKNLAWEDFGELDLNGSFLTDGKVVDVKQIHSWGRDPIDAEKLWTLSEDLVSQKFAY
ncbi:uncharacterized protein E0L32_009845 [Thyridium curvatum]|uniref:Uncharacterized protein n=1 Tax=Thyridium curvatum TaxID=1093900 RepID=A0A507APK4_9PEZI|nr:uncharacterized protein E0L32_009845 [Thyridium curvatum]TPX08656.1 hypothetical protein E0L32_009845 [Thyridium curvatum]